MHRLPDERDVRKQGKNGDNVEPPEEREQVTFDLDHGKEGDVGFRPGVANQLKYESEHTYCIGRSECIIY
jgi:hypothetical protein